jgi:AcrR family transcriptional regulator
MVEVYEERKEQILVEARGLFARYGFRKCAIHDIAQACGLSKTALYHYFANKEEIFTAVVRRETDLLLSALEEATRAHSDPLERLYAFNLTKVDKIQDLFNLYSISRETREGMAPLVKKAREEYFSREQQMLEAILEEGIAEGRFRPLPVSLAARTAIAAFQGLELYLFSEEADALLEAMTKFLDILAYGLVRQGKEEEE